MVASDGKQILWVGILLGVAATLDGADCNANGRDDTEDVSRAMPGLETYLMQALDAAPRRLIDGFDLDLDGDAEIVVRYEGKDEITIHESRDGRFASPRLLVAGPVPLAVAAADLEGDRFPELIVACWGSGELVIFRGTSGLELATRKALKLDQRKVYDVSPDDFDGDGDLDLAVLTSDAHESEPGRLDVLWNDGSSAFTLRPQDASQARYPRDIVSFDRDADGDVDAVTMSHGATLSAFVNENGRLNLRSEHTLQGQPGSLQVLRSGTGMLLVADARNVITLFASHQEETLREVQSLNIGVGGVAAAVGDWNRDGFDDVLVSRAWARQCPSRHYEPLLYVGASQGLGNGESIGPPRPDLDQPILRDLDGSGWPAVVATSSSPPSLQAFRLKVVKASFDCNQNFVPDECEVESGDCDQNDVPDACDLAQSPDADCDRNGVLDQCQVDCNQNAIADNCELLSGKAEDCNLNGVLDACEAFHTDLDLDGVPDECTSDSEPAIDCNQNGQADTGDLAFAARFDAQEVVPTVSSGLLWEAADMDGDGRTDVVVAERRGKECSGVPGRLRVLLRSASSWLEGESLPTFADPRALISVDIEGDGDIDVALAGEVIVAPSVPRDWLDVYVNCGHGQLKKQQRLAPGGEPVRLFARDVNADGDQDLWVSIGTLNGFKWSNVQVKTTQIFLNLGDGHFHPDSRQPLPQSAVTAFCEDFDQNGSPDSLAMANPGGRLVLMLNNGFGIFQEGEAIGLFNRPDQLHAGDVDNDFDVDLVGIPDMFDKRLRVYLNSGNATFVEKWQEPLSPLDPEVIGSLLDIDADSDLDVLGGRDSSRGGHLTFRPNDGLGRFGQLVDITTVKSLNAELLLYDQATPARFPLQSVGDPPAFPFVSTSSQVTDIDTNDLDGDNHADVILAQHGKLTIRWGAEAGGIDSLSELEVDSNPLFVRSADLDRDGDVDLITANFLADDLPANVTILRNGSQRRFAKTRNYAAGRLPTGLELLDVEGDADFDIAVANFFGDSVTLLRNQGDAKFPVTESIAVGHPASGLAVGDFDGDHDADLATLHPYPTSDAKGIELLSRAAVVWNHGGKLEQVMRVPLLADVSWLTAADFNQDGHSDLVVATSASDGGVVAVLRGLTGESFVPPLTILASDSYINHLAAGDVNGDGHVDLLAPLDRHWERLEVLLNYGDGAQFFPLGLQAHEALRSGVLRDLTGDGLPEILGIGYYRSGLVAIKNLSVARSVDADHDGIPDECTGASAIRFQRGDASDDGILNLTDPIVILNYLFHGDARVACLDAADADDDGNVSLTDAVRLLLRLFGGGSFIPEPTSSCGFDPSLDTLHCSGFTSCRP